MMLRPQMAAAIAVTTEIMNLKEIMKDQLHISKLACMISLKKVCRYPYYNPCKFQFFVGGGWNLLSGLKKFKHLSKWKKLLFTED